jgi:hypothetical protein
MTNERNEWLASLKVGDEVYDGSNIKTITGETPTRWQVGNAEYRKDNGDYYPRQTWGGKMLYPVTARERIQRDLRRFHHLIKSLPSGEFAFAGREFAITDEARSRLGEALLAVQRYAEVARETPREES